MTQMQPGGYAEQEMNRIRKQLAAHTGVHPELRDRLGMMVRSQT